MDGSLEINGTDYRITKHALKRMNTRKITIEDLIEAISAPKSIRRQSKAGFEDSFLIIGRNKVNVILNLHKNVVITVHKLNHHYGKVKNKKKKNTKRRDLIKVFGNRVKR